MIDGLEANIQGLDNDFYYPKIYNRLTSSQVVSYQTFATQVNANKTEINKTLNTNDFVNVDSDGAVWWSTGLAEVITTNIQVANGSSFRWYEYKW
jgi:hypothetical protein